ncbi:MAG: hypothetical protein IKO62_05315, partial [Bacteroidales bacterium]|nr:hypothetical protein [Bacteroidales bacterium]
VIFCNFANRKSLSMTTMYDTLGKITHSYFYLPNGMLSRVELGQKSVQGTDYAYTLQGWLKDINGYRTSEGLIAAYDIGHDGQLNMGTINSEFCRDAFGSMLQYHQGDYRPISGNNYYNKEYSAAVPLFNGNISALTTGYLTTGVPPMVKFFRYDKLNRIKRMETCMPTSSPIWLCVGNQYATNYSYDYNGNIMALQRYNENANIKHDISYHYSPNCNRLNAITATGLNSGTYRYDAVGNLFDDTGENLEISWNAAGKVDTIWKNGNLLSTFLYSATGQRQVKKTGNNTYYYIHDASGNVMCIYKQIGSSLYMEEQPIYGSKRLGEYKRRMQNPSGTLRPEYTGTIGYRQYELTDHLGNVMATILDRRQPYSSGDATYKPYIISTTDYYPFGNPIANRSTNIGGYRYFFNGQEGDNEVFGAGYFQNYGFRMYDTRIARFWGIDPLTKDYPMLTPFQFASNTPIWAIYMDGLEAVVRPARNANTRPLIYRENNNYARTEYGRLPSTRTIRTDTYRYSTNNGARQIVSSPAISYVYDYKSPQGNDVSMSYNNIQAQMITLLGDACQIYINKIEDKINTPQGYKIGSNIQITFVKIQDRLIFDQLQKAYDVLLAQTIEEIPEPDMSFPPWTSELTQQMIKQAERTRLAKEKLGPSPNDMLMRTILYGEKTKMSEKTEKINLPEIRPAENY